MINFLKQNFITEKYIGIFQSIMLILFFIVFLFILFLVFIKSEKYYKEVSIIPLEGKK
ncbi:cytochrome oxidase [Blattabacterium punctulatus]|uniref:cytochrome oxidase n=1 Tax=Blattabacterium punctulatus TaxID=164514 RepID=UPI000D7BBDD1|nr:cytochrome oxidase [Blattabacterium punctulatus]AWU44375.1 cytochrome oxidase [Blattabacterium punctulatus]AWU45460.1 cytochrome oxidase [Blattabacterium punctulatus]